jgi:hypothetical protein
LAQSRCWPLGLSPRNSDVFLRVKPRGRLDTCPPQADKNQNPFFEIAYSKKLSREDVCNKLKVAKTAKIFFDPDIKWAPEQDFDLCLNIGLCNFVLKAEKMENGLLALRPIYS